MNDFSLLSGSQAAVQNAQLSKFNALADKIQNGQQDLAPLDNAQIQDGSFQDALQKRKIKETAVEFEAQFLGQMLQPMFEGLETDSMFGGGHAEEMWKGMLIQEYGKSIAQNGGVGLADQVQKELLKMQEGK